MIYFMKLEYHGNTENTIKFVSELIQENKNKKLVIIWDGASYHRSQEWRDYLEELNKCMVH